MILFAYASGCSNHVTGQPDLNKLLGSNWEAHYAQSLEKKYGKDNFGTILDTYDKAAPADKEQIRNNIITELMWLSDYTFNHDTDALLSGDNSINFVGDVITLGLTSAATITGGTEAKTILSGVATVVTGVKTSYDADYLHKQTVTTIINQMNASRATAKTALVTGLAESDEEYPLRTKALPDFIAFDEAGSIAQAIVSLEQTSGQSAQTSQQNLNTATTQAALKSQSRHK
jgi:hypothetical protein